MYSNKIGINNNHSKVMYMSFPPPNKKKKKIQYETLACLV